MKLKRFFTAVAFYLIGLIVTACLFVGQDLPKGTQLPGPAVLDSKDAQIATLKAKVEWLEGKVVRQEAALKAVLDMANSPQWAEFQRAQALLREHETRKPVEKPAEKP
jgi:hypothetical protein